MKLLLITVITICWGTMLSQHNPVSFDISQNDDTLIFNATIETGWHLYAANLPNPEEGPLPTEIYIDANAMIDSTSAIYEGEGHTEMDDAFGIEVKYFETNATFKQRVITKEKITPITGVINYMVCNDAMCIPFDVPFSYTFIKNK